ncbi:hypothetical protein [Zeaxanthinibacter enoshimensis]|uniref:GDSL-like lipase/acylhydrolase family protein n=1 Tax=Zeaxanthinibacter enoshimensis TaxID=392009 RepID=A0A4R6TIR3_9FLAO|nr:hypothetical protein [Zeaxanthinibacter enoshimensis]TDQ29069.1 hypothetical protein CLV82_2519 [Zeaxanthinibacter enoshimensis]
MRKYLLNILIFFFCAWILGEIIIRVFHLVPDIPKRIIEPEMGLQIYEPGQSGYYTMAEEKWKVNQHGWVGVANSGKKAQISVIGDSYIENLMNPLRCHQGYLLENLLKDYSVFEAGRSGVTFIEALQISKLLDPKINPKYHLIYVNEGDFKESIAGIRRYKDRVQIDLEQKRILQAELKSPVAKQILYSNKFLYYLYLRFPLFVSDQDKNKVVINKTDNKKFHQALIDLFEFCEDEFDTNRIILVFHPNTDPNIQSLAKNAGFNTISLYKSEEDNWSISSEDPHWSCYGHQQAAEQIASEFPKLQEDI